MNIRPPKACCFAIADVEMEEEVGGIFIPESAKARNYPGFKGTVVLVNEEGADLCGLLGKSCLFASWAGQGFRFDFEWEGKKYEYLYKYRLILDEIVAVFDVEEGWMPTRADGDVTTPGEPGTYRCPFCKSPNGQANMLVDGNRVCPFCNRTPDGKKHIKHKHTMPDGHVIETDFEPTLSRDEEEEFGFETPRVKSSKKITYPNMDKKG